MKERGTITVDGVLDIETYRWDKFLCACILTTDGKYHVFRRHQEKEYIQFLLNFEGHLWSHNGGKFDNLHAASHFADMGLKAVIKLAGQRIISLRINELVLRDSLALIPFDLRKAAKLGDFEKLDCPIPFSHFGPNMSEADMLEIIEYMKGDCRCLLSSLMRLKEWAEAVDVDLSATIGSSAYKTVSRRFDIPEADWSDEKGKGSGKRYEKVRLAYFGGRVSVFQTHERDGGFYNENGEWVKGIKHGWRYDANSAYPFAMSTVPLPTGARHETSGSASRRAFRDGREGVFDATVSVPDSYIPPLPMRGRVRIGFPIGKFSGTWTALELRYAESVGVKILNISDAIWWEKSEILFNSFCNQFFDIRKQKGPDTAWGQFCKWFPNACSGKFAMGPEMDRVIINPEEEPNECGMGNNCRGRCHPAKGCCEHRCWGRCPSPINRERSIWRFPMWRLDPCAHVHWAAYVTAHARTRLHAQLCSDGAYGWTSTYCDTDSCFATQERTDWIGGELGQWKPEGEFWNMQILGPKMYSFYEESGKRKAKAKGIPDAVKHFDALADGEEIPIKRGVMTFKSAARSASGKLFQRKNMTRQLKRRGQYVGDRRVDKHGRTWPLTAEEFLSLEG